MPRTVWLLVAARAINRLGAFSLPFLTVLISTDFGAGALTGGLLAGAFGLATIPSRLLGGRLAGRLGRRRTIVLGLTGCGLAQLGIAAAGSLPAVAAWAVLLGLFFELYEPPSQGMIADAVGPADRVRAYGLLNAALAVGGTGAGLLAALLGRWDLRWLFVADALTCLLCALTVQLTLPPDPRRPAARQRATAAPVHPWRDRALWAVFLCGTAFALVAMQVVTALPLTLERYGLRPADAGLLFTVSALTVVAAQPLLRLRRLAALPAPAALALGHALLAVGLTGYATSRTLPAFAAASVVWALGEAVVLARVLSVVADLAPPGGADRYLAAYGTSWGIATAAAPVTATQLLERLGAVALWSTAAALCLTLAAAQLLVVKPLLCRARPPHEAGPDAPGASRPEPAPTGAAARE
ncbi:MFS transporter [Streptomyces sp. NPDC089919]|uniref:MFS transporter n=1 Tax=Streptomyces sp. NPDC089919 TaxID=3155188 RepID=UPI0034253BD2